MSDKKALGYVEVALQDKVATLTFYHPASNSFPNYLLQKLVEEINRLSVNDAVNVVVLQSETDVFCAGASFDELLSIQNKEDGALFFSGFAKVINAMRTCSKLIIGRVQGKAVGGGVGLIAACDYVVAIEKSALKLSELSIGIGPFVIEPAITRKIGISAFAEMSLSPMEWKTSQWAQEKGLFSKVVTNQDQLDHEIALKASELAGYNPNALLELKKIAWQGTEKWDQLLLERAAISGDLVLSDFTKQALEKYKK